MYKFPVFKEIFFDTMGERFAFTHQKAENYIKVTQIIHLVKYTICASIFVPESPDRISEL
jgi:hypothetical protein